MRTYLQTLFAESGTLSTEAIALHILCAAVISCAIYASYWFTHTGTAYSKKFNVSLVTLTILTATVMTVIGNNVALSLGMVGALSIVRFRTAIKDSRDTTYIFWAIIVGICCGVGDYLVATIGTVVVFVVLLLFGRVRNENRFLLIVHARKNVSTDVEKAIFDHYSGKAMLRSKSTNATTCEFIYELTRSVYLKAQKNNQDISMRLDKVGGVEYVNLVAQSDEITG